MEKWAEQLLARWGVLLRDLLAREAGAPAWRDLLPILRRMEARGQIAEAGLSRDLQGSSLRGLKQSDLLRARTSVG